MKTILTIIITLLVLPTVRGETPYELERLNDQRGRKIAEIDQVYKKQLEELKAKYTKAGNLEAANQVVDILKGLSPEEAPTFLGKWYQVANEPIDLKENGSIVCSDGKRGKWTATATTLTCVFPNGTMTFTLPVKDDTLNGTWSNGVAYKWTRGK